MITEYQVSIAVSPTDGKGNPLVEPKTETYWVIGKDKMEAINAVVDIMEAKQWQTREAN